MLSKFPDHEAVAHHQPKTDEEYIQLGIQAFWIAEKVRRGSSGKHAWEILDVLGIPKHIQAKTWRRWDEAFGKALREREEKSGITSHEPFEV